MSKWISTDPILNLYINGKKSGGGIYNSTNLNLYNYGGNNPIKYIDPNGKEITVKKNNNTYNIKLTKVYNSMADYKKQNTDKKRHLMKIQDGVYKTDKYGNKQYADGLATVKGTTSWIDVASLGQTFNDKNSKFPSEPSFEYLVSHELGHNFGLDHLNSKEMGKHPTNVMFDGNYRDWLPNEQMDISNEQLNTMYNLWGN